MHLKGFELKKQMNLGIYVIVLLTLNITKVISLTDTLKFNMAISDVVILFATLTIIVDAIKKKTLKVFYGLPLFCILVVWIVFTGYLGIESESIIDDGLFGIFEELVKTVLCILYFFVGYNSLNILNENRFKKLWAFSIFLFIIGGLLIFLLASKDVFYWSEDPKYLFMFMGTDTDPNHAATFLTLSFFGMGIFALEAKNIKLRFLFIIAMLFSVFGIILTGSRGGLIGFVTGLCVLFLYYLVNNWRLALSLILIFIVVFLVFIQFDLTILDGQFSQLVIGKLKNFESSLDTRLSLSHTALLMGNDNPITGVGRGNYVLNSASYFENIGVDFVDNIPHNTYLGLYAEVGLIGILLFFSPVWLLFLAVYRRYKLNYEKFTNEFEGLSWLISGVIAIAIQAFVLNMENRRYLWYLAGVIVFVFQNQTRCFEITHANVRRYWEKGISISLVIIVALFVYVSFNAHIPVKNTVVKVDGLTHYEYAVQMKALNLGTLNTIGLNLNVPSNSELSQRVKLTINEVDEGGTIRVLKEVEYDGINGKVFLQFTPNNDAESVFVKLIILDSNLEQFEFKPLCIISNKSVYELDKDYFLQPSFIRNALIEKKKIPLKDYIPKSDFSDSLDKTFSSYFRIKGIDYEFYDETDKDGNVLIKTQVFISYEVLKKPVFDYIFVLRGYPFDLVNMDDNIKREGYEQYELKNTVLSSHWEQGNTYTVSFVVPRNRGVYRLQTGIYRYGESTLEFLMLNEGKPNPSAFLDIGWINLGETTMMY